MKKALLILGLLALPAAAQAACPTTSLTFKDAAGTTQTLCFGGSSGQFLPQNQIIDSSGNAYVADPCETVAKSYTPISITANSQTITGTSGKKTYICAINLVVAAATNVALVEGTTGGVCASGTAGMAGGITAATGWNFAANGGLTHGTGKGTVMASATAGKDVCLFVSPANQVSGTVAWVQQ